MCRPVDRFDEFANTINIDYFGYITVAYQNPILMKNDCCGGWWWCVNLFQCSALSLTKLNSCFLMSCLYFGCIKGNIAHANCMKFFRLGDQSCANMKLENKIDNLRKWQSCVYGKLSILSHRKSMQIKGLKPWRVSTINFCVL